MTLPGGEPFANRLLPHATKFIKINPKHHFNKSIPSVNGMLHKDSIVKIDEITTSNPVRGSIRVTDSLGKIWWVEPTHISCSFL